MGTRITGYKILIGLMVLQGPAAYAADKPAALAPLNLEAKYVVAWNGITIGRVNLTAKETAKLYSMNVDTKTHGIATIFNTERRIAEANGTVNNGRYIPARYASFPQGKDEGRRTTLTYANNGKISNRERVPDDDVTWRVPVPEAQVNNATDPVTAGFILRKQLHEAIEAGKSESMVKTYDGARLAEMRFTVIKPSAKVQVMDSYRDTVTTIVTRQPIAGYTSKEIKTFTKGDPVVHLYFSADDKFMPLRATVSTNFGELSATLTELK